jgi:hypothetical protein
MKKRSLLKKLSGAAISLILLSGLLSLETTAQSTISRPGKSMNYIHNRINWIHTSNTDYTYNNDGELISSVKTDPVTNQNISKTEVILDSLNRIMLASGYLWQNNSWVVNFKDNHICTYNAANQVTEFIYQRWKNGALENEHKFNSVYDTAGNLVATTHFEWVNNTWETIDRTLSTYVNGVQTESIKEVYSKNTNSWRPTFKETYGGWQRPGMWSSLVLQTYNATTGWVNFRRYTNTMGQNGGYETLAEAFQNGIWVYDTRQTMIYDVRGDHTDYLAETFVNGTWRMDWTNKYIYTYNSHNDLLQKVYQSPDINSGPIRDQTKDVYSNFQYFTRTLGTPEARQAGLALTLYPNPAQDLLHIDLAGNTQRLQKVTISDLTGKTVLSQTFEAEDRKQVQVEQLPAGIYLLNLETDKGTVVKKFVKQ